MDLNAKKEQFSQAYVQAVAAVAGYCWSKPSVDDDSIDLTLSAKGSMGTYRSPKLDLQLKCHASTQPITDFPFPLKLKNYDDLRDSSVLVPRILVVVVVPDLLADWLVHSEPEMILRRCGYWKSIRGEPATSNSTSVTVTIERAQLFCPSSLTSIMQRIGSGGLP